MQIPGPPLTLKSHTGKVVLAVIIGVAIWWLWSRRACCAACAKGASSPDHRPAAPAAIKGPSSGAGCSPFACGGK